MLKCSIIIVNTNNKKLLEECLSSIYDFTKELEFEIIVCDNGSTDGSPQMVEKKFPQVKLLAFKENLGFIKAVNKGIGAARGEYVIFLNDDTRLIENSFLKLISFMEKHPKAAIASPKLLYPDLSPQRHGNIFSSLALFSDKVRESKFVSGACMVLRRTILDKIGWLDENLYFYNDDIDICLRARKAGYKVYYFPETRIIHYGGASSRRTFNPKLVLAGIQGGLYLAYKHYGIFWFNLYRLFLLIFLVIIGLPFYLLIPKKNYSLKLKTFFDVLKILPNPLKNLHLNK